MMIFGYLQPPLSKIIELRCGIGRSCGDYHVPRLVPVTKRVAGRTCLHEIFIESGHKQYYGVLLKGRGSVGEGQSIRRREVSRERACFGGKGPWVEGWPAGDALGESISVWGYRRLSSE